MFFDLVVVFFINRLAVAIVVLRQMSVNMKVDGRERIESSASARFFSVSDEPHVDGSGELTVPITVHVQDDPSNASQTMVGGEAMMGISEDPPNTFKRYLEEERQKMLSSSEKDAGIRREIYVGKMEKVCRILKG